MKLIIAIIRPEKLEAVQAALTEHEVYLMTVSDVRGCGRQRGFTETYRGNEVVIRLLSKVKLEIAVNDDFVEPAVQAIMTPPRLARSATARSSCCPWKSATASAPAKPAGMRTGREV